MDKSNLELFKQALSEGVSKKFDQMADECTEEIKYSKKHELAMRKNRHEKDHAEENKTDYSYNRSRRPVTHKLRYYLPQRAA